MHTQVFILHILFITYNYNVTIDLTATEEFIGLFNKKSQRFYSNYAAVYKIITYHNNQYKCDITVKLVTEQGIRVFPNVQLECKLDNNIDNSINNIRSETIAIHDGGMNVSISSLSGLLSWQPGHNFEQTTTLPVF